jgi:hypothetical protein
LLAPQDFASVDHLVREASQANNPGEVILVAGSVPLDWRAGLRSAGLSFVDVSGVADIRWPRITVRASRGGQNVRRRRAPLPFQKNYARVVQVILIDAFAGRQPSIGEVAERARTNVSSASRAVSQLASFGLLYKVRVGKSVRIEVPERVELAALLAERTAWTSDRVLTGYLWGRTSWDRVRQLTDRAETNDVELAVTGRMGAAALGVVGTSSPSMIRCWVSGQGSLSRIAEALAIEPAPEDEANVELAADTWGFGLHHAGYHTVESGRVKTAHPLRVWCDLHAEQRGDEFAAQLWSQLSHVE